MPTAQHPGKLLPRNTLAESLDAGKLGLTMIIKQVESPDIALAAKKSGYDAIYVDLEYGIIPESAVAPIAAAARQVGIAALVRIPSADAACATRCLQAGALGIVVPKVKTIDQVAALVKACKTAPLGTRAIDEDWFAGEENQRTIADKQAIMNARTTLIIMLESPEALALAEEIAAMPGVDIVHIGTSDLSQALGIPDRYDHPFIEEAYTRVIAACRKHHKVAGAGGMTSNRTIASKVINMGVRFMTAGNEWAFMMSAASERAATLRGLPL
jgi:2-keto-3-deoxy-L-rhamnonate aldolase RhmA